MTPDCVKSTADEACAGYQIIRAHLDVEREVQKKLILERDKWFNEAMRLKAELCEARSAVAAPLEDTEGDDCACGGGAVSGHAIGCPER